MPSCMYRDIVTVTAELLLLITEFTFTEQTTAQRNVCPPWFTPDNKSSTGYLLQLLVEVKCVSRLSHFFTLANV